MLRSNQQPDSDVRKLCAHELKQYFQRIGIQQQDFGQLLAGPSLEALTKIHRHQVKYVHITNFDMQAISKRYSRDPISPRFEDIFSKIVSKGRHGYCFENNRLLQHVLVSLGYKLNFYNAHIIRNNVPKDDAQHVIMMVELNGKEYLVDAGYGGVAPVAVTEMVLDVEQTGAGKAWQTTSASGNKYKMIDGSFKFDGKNEENGLVVCHEYRKPDSDETAWKPLYIFRRKPCDPMEFIIANARVSKNDETTPFKTKVFETAFKGDTRKSLTQDELHITASGKTILHKPVKNEEKYHKYSVKHFGHFSGGPVRDRVKFGNPSEACLSWYRDYKEQKQAQVDSAPAEEGQELSKSRLG